MKLKTFQFSVTHSRNRYGWRRESVGTPVYLFSVRSEISSGFRSSRHCLVPWLPTYRRPLRRETLRDTPFPFPFRVPSESSAITKTIPDSLLVLGRTVRLFLWPRGSSHPLDFKVRLVLKEGKDVWQCPIAVPATSLFSSYDWVRTNSRSGNGRTLKSKE